MNDGAIYPYADGDRLEDRNRYSYAPALGQEMLDAWRAQRCHVLAGLPPHRARSSPQAPVRPWPDEDVQTGPLLDLLLAHIAAGAAEAPETKEWLDRLVGKFEVTKRVHAAYGAGFRALDRSRYGDLSLYVRMAQVFEAAYDATGNLAYLNALLKVIDTLCSIEIRLSDALRADLAWLIVREGQHVDRLAERAVAS